ncbi:ABC transporter ATP-binding protein [Trichlorobacter ammonificans]|uniref:Murein tripeptide ABC transporter/oligopeptide ABC transporter ATP binding subunit OppD n=1 Tax=Trichlorobacter ammonificans TaxID=2916410 RepID=A0ABN8HFU6_9BACT|nr:ABC transporter ATP-binding protein [Trichlorobacter ammonificans]CAH2031651.1 murein tripeptide ABC transporter/oligopeptide ABC transporter ATP binding subunit OppD [Trichlorobacter ammonificans]
MPLLEIDNLTTVIPTHRGTVYAVNGASLTLDRGETVALVGESGSGKSMTARSILGLVPAPGRIAAGSIRFGGRELTELSGEELRRLRGNRIAMVFQEPMTSLNPVLRIGEQMLEPLLLHRGLSRAEATTQATELLRQVGIAAPDQRLRDYPHQLSGGMRQRVMIAMALACGPELLIADEPTTALDVTIQAQILALIDRLRREKGLALLLITHDLGIVAERADRVHVMYAGRIVESADTRDLFACPQHPYTRGLLASLPENAVAGAPLATIPGHPPAATGDEPGCPFRDRCDEAFEPCGETMPDSREVRPAHRVRCWRRR